MDNNYIHWASLTKTSDKQVNEKIFNHVANDAFMLVSHEYLALESANIKYKDLRNWFSSRLVREDRHNMAWKTPFGHYYGADQIQYNGKYFAEDVSYYLESLQKICRFREAVGDYSIILRTYLNKLSEDNRDYRYYEEVKPLIGILESEDYLRVSENNEIRELYKKCMDQCANLYNRYMTEVR